MLEVVRVRSVAEGLPAVSLPGEVGFGACRAEVTESLRFFLQMMVWERACWA